MKEKRKVIICIILFITIILYIAADVILFFGRSKGEKSYISLEKQQEYINSENEAEIVSIRASDFVAKPGNVVKYEYNDNLPDNYREDDENVGDDIEDDTEDDSIKSGYYIFPDSDSKYLKKSKVKKLSKKKLRLARNELYVRHGYIFDDEELYNYFSDKDWYNPAIPSDEFNDSEYFNKYEIANRNLIKNIEAKK